MRFVVTIRKPAADGGPVPTYYLTADGTRCYTWQRVAVFPSVDAARKAADLAAVMMGPAGFRLAVERLRGDVRSVQDALLSAVEVTDPAPCPACGRLYDVTAPRPPRVPLDIRCACCCQP